MPTRRRYAAERLVFFSDAVFAIAMTLLVLDLKVPELGESATRAQVEATLLSRVPALGAMLISFIVIASLWTSHHRRFDDVEQVDDEAIRLDLALLFFVALLPLPTSLVFAPTGGSPWPVALYALTIGFAFLALAALGRHLFRAGLTQQDPTAYTRGQRALAPVWSVFLLSAPLAFLDPRLAYGSWILLAPIQALVQQLARRRH